LYILFACLLLAVVAWVVFDRRRHTRLKTACVAAFEHAYSLVSPRPALEMGYSYGEPVFQVQFGSKADMQAAADANAAFLGAIDALCKDRGRRRQFKAQRAVFFQYPTEDDLVVTHCCDTMRAQVGKAIVYSPEARAYGLRTSSVGTPSLAIAHCPWCAAALAPVTEAQPR
jgi:hypothetical protein